MPTITSEIFRVLHMGTIYNALVKQILRELMFFLFGRLRIYDRETGEQISCFGVQLLYGILPTIAICELLLIPCRSHVVVPHKGILQVCCAKKTRLFSNKVL